MDIGRNDVAQQVNLLEMKFETQLSFAPSTFAPFLLLFLHSHFFFSSFFLCPRISISGAVHGQSSSNRSVRLHIPIALWLACCCCCYYCCCSLSNHTPRVGKYIYTLSHSHIDRQNSVIEVEIGYAREICNCKELFFSVIQAVGLCFSFSSPPHSSFTFISYRRIETQQTINNNPSVGKEKHLG